MTVQRYTLLEYHHRMMPDGYGDYVLWTDYAALEAELAEAERDRLPCQVLDVLDCNRKLQTERDRYREALVGIRKMCEDQYSDGDHWIDANYVIARVDKALAQPTEGE